MQQTSLSGMFLNAFCIFRSYHTGSKNRAAKVQAQKIMNNFCQKDFIPSVSLTWQE
jgi:hypothetical protein